MNRSIQSGLGKMAQNEDGELLRGTTLKVYRFLLKSGKPTGVREVQRSLNMSSPSLAMYHLSKLEEAGLLKREGGDYTVNKVILEGMIKIGHVLIPRYFFYSLFAVLALIVELTLLRPTTLTRGYLFSTTALLVLALAFCYETAKIWVKGGL